MVQWNISGDLCGDCYSEKLKQYYIAEDRRNIAKKLDRLSKIETENISKGA